jgi:large subunit ribosomal protein L15
MKLNELQNNTGALKKPKRVGRGIGSGTGKTAGSGQKGQKARSGVAIKGFEGGQMPLQRRLPKRGFVHIGEPTCIMNLSDIQEGIDNKKLSATEITAEALAKAGMIRNADWSLRILARGVLNQKTVIKANHFSKSAKEAIEKAGGKAEVINQSE